MLGFLPSHAILRFLPGSVKDSKCVIVLVAQHGKGWLGSVSGAIASIQLHCKNQYINTIDLLFLKIENLYVQLSLWLGSNDQILLVQHHCSCLTKLELAIC